MERRHCRRIALVIAVIGVVAVADPPPESIGNHWAQGIERARAAFAAGEYADAERLVELALDEAEGFGESDGRLRETLDLLVEVYASQGLFEQAHSILARIRDHHSRITPHDHRLEASNLLRHASILIGLCRLDEAERRLGRVEELHSELLEGDDPEIVLRLEELAALRLAQSRWTEAEDVLRRALEMREQSFGFDRIGIALCLNRLAGAQIAQERAQDAEQMCERALEILSTTLRAEHPHLAPVLINLARVRTAQSRFAEAESLCKRAIEIQEIAFGEDHPDVGESLVTLGNVYDNYCVQRKQKDLFNRAYAIWETAYPPDDLRLAARLEGLADRLDFVCYRELTEPSYKRAIAIRAKAFGRDHVEVGRLYHKLGRRYHEDRMCDEVKKPIERAIAILEASLGTFHPELIPPLTILAEHADSCEGRNWLEVFLYTRILGIQIRTLGYNHFDVAVTLGHLSLAYRRLGYDGIADRLNERALEILERVLPPDHPQLGRGLLSVAGELIYRGKYEQAEVLLNRAKLIYDQARGRDRMDLHSVLSMYENLYRAMGRDAEAAEYHRQFVETR